MTSQNKARPSLDKVCTLLRARTKKDDAGNLTPLPCAEREIFCAELSATRSDFWAARQAGLHCDYVLAVDKTEYDGEEKVRYCEKTLSVYRAYGRADGMIELSLAGKVGAAKNGDGH